MKPPEIASSFYPRTFLMMVVALSFGIFVHIVFLSIFYYYDVKPLYYFNYFSISLFAILLYLLIKKNMVSLAMAGASIELILHQVFSVLLIGWEYGFQYYLIVIPGFILLKKFKTPTIPILLTVISYILLTLLYFHSVNNSPSYQMEEVKNSLYILNLLSVTTLVAVFNALFDYTSRLHEHALRDANVMLYQSATTDSMTKLPNRMHSIELIKNEMVRNKRSDGTFTLALADVDDFKVINDSFGHDAGDKVLITISKIMKDALREQDVIGRWGGEEFLILLPDTSMENGKIALDKLKESLSRTFIKYNTVSIKVTITIGVTSSRHSESIDELIKLADNALYEGKRGTKNCVVVIQP